MLSAALLARVASTVVTAARGLMHAVVFAVPSQRSEGSPTSLKDEETEMGGMLFEAIHRIAELAAKSDVHGTPRVSISFDSPADAARFRAEAEREIKAAGLSMTYDGHMDLHNCKIHGVDVRIL